MDKASLNKFKSQLESLAKGHIQDNSVSKNSASAKELNKPSEMSFPLDKQKEKELKKGKEANPQENKDLNSSKNKVDPEQLGQTFFSFFFELKEGI